MLNQVGWQRQKIKKEIHNVLMTFSVCLRGLLKNRKYLEGQELSGHTLWEAGPRQKGIKRRIRLPRWAVQDDGPRGPQRMQRGRISTPVPPQIIPELLSFTHSRGGAEAPELFRDPRY